MDNQVKYMLHRCFDEDIRDLVYSKHIKEIGDYIDDEHQEYLAKAKDIEPFIGSLWGVEKNIKRASFDKYYTFDNLATFKEFFIKEIEDFALFSMKYREHGWTLFLGDEPCYNWKKTYGKESYHCFARVLTKHMLYNGGYQQAKDVLRGLNIPRANGGTVSDYVDNGLVEFQPLALKTIEYLKTL